MASRPELLRVLYIHPVGAFGGASRSLLELVQAFPKGAVEARVIVPIGSAATQFERHGMAVMRVPGISRFDTTRYGYYRGLRWLILLREIYFAPATLFCLWRARGRWSDVDLIHVNELVALLPGILAKMLLGKPLVVHVRSVQEDRRARLRRAFLRRLLKRRADAVVAIDETVRSSLPDAVPAVVVHNAYRASENTGTPPAVERLATRLHPGSLRVGMVGTLLAYKGIFEFIEAARLVLAQVPNVDFVLVGSNTRKLVPIAARLLSAVGLAQDMERDIDRRIAAHALQSRVHRVEFIPDVSALYRTLDVLCFPSHLDAIGRPVIEAAWHSIPSIVAVAKPLPDTFVPGETGLTVPPYDAGALARAILHFATHPDERAHMGRAARQLAERNFDSQKNALRMLDIYGALVASKRAA